MRRIRNVRFIDLLRDNREAILNDREAMNRIEERLDAKRK
ncbi:FbpB family small basic protein [Natribacillus halophilus]|uniref:Fur-regulated basic protein B n=1 Tax=Natribacillus halophilus TaxID=549003 RepID=A0A1G8SIK9_9BACI|nr:FbpB family small basic protein [Natribacillus halophilus]SDJ28993.1 Fur-regulated basic protein B [Natribacillus halophilus]